MSMRLNCVSSYPEFVNALHYWPSNWGHCQKTQTIVAKGFVTWTGNIHNWQHVPTFMTQVHHFRVLLDRLTGLMGRSYHFLSNWNLTVIRSYTNSFPWMLEASVEATFSGQPYCAGVTCRDQVMPRDWSTYGISEVKQRVFSSDHKNTLGDISSGFSPAQEFLFFWNPSWTSSRKDARFNISRKIFKKKLTQCMQVAIWPYAKYRDKFSSANYR